MPLELVQDVLVKTPKGNPTALERQLVLEEVAKELQKAVYDWGQWRRWMGAV